MNATADIDLDARPSEYGLSVNAAIANMKKNGLANLLAGTPAWELPYYAADAHRAVAEGRSFKTHEAIAAYVLAKYEASNARWHAAFDAWYATVSADNLTGDPELKKAFCAVDRSHNATRSAITRQFGIKF